MSGSLSLQLALYRRQNARIAEAVQGHSPSFRAYESRYLRATSGRYRAVPRREVTQAILRADVVYVGDYHTLRLSQRTYLELVDEARTGPHVVLAVEFVEGQHQQHLDAYQAGKLTDRAFLARLGRGTPEGNELWTGFKPVLEYARRHGLEVVAVDKRSGGPRSLASRDAYTAERVASVLRRPEAPRVMVLMGQYHVAPCHLPQAVERALGPGTGRQGVIVYQNCERVWWSLARARKVDAVEAVRLSPGAYCLMRASPVVCQQSFLDYLEAERGDETLEDSSITERFRELAALVGASVGAPPGDALEDVVVGRTADPDFLSELQARGNLDRKEMAQLRRHLLENQSCYVPAARMACLASLSLNHVAEEATHFVRHAAVGEAMVAPRRPVDAFYARCMEEALGFLGSKLLNPRRVCVDLAGWTEQFRSGRGEAREVAAFVLAHKAAEAEGPEAAARLLPLRRERLFHAWATRSGTCWASRSTRAWWRGRWTARPCARCSGIRSRTRRRRTSSGTTGGAGPLSPRAEPGTAVTARARSPQARSACASTGRTPSSPAARTPGGNGGQGRGVVDASAHQGLRCGQPGPARELGTVHVPAQQGNTGGVHTAGTSTPVARRPLRAAAPVPGPATSAGRPGTRGPGCRPRWCRPPPRLHWRPPTTPGRTAGLRAGDPTGPRGARASPAPPGHPGRPSPRPPAPPPGRPAARARRG